jgi:hypothetical protein
MVGVAWVQPIHANLQGVARVVSCLTLLVSFDKGAAGLE